MKICVFGAASEKIDLSYITAGERLGEIIAKHGHYLIFGGGDDGLMGATARGVREHGGKMTGITPRFFKVDGELYDKCDELIFTDTMRERKRQLEDSCDAFIITPGGIGTFDEFFEILTLKKLNQLDKPIVVMNTDGYYNRLLSYIKFSIKGGFVGKSFLDIFKVVKTPEEAVDYLEKALK